MRRRHLVYSAAAIAMIACLVLPAAADNKVHWDYSDNGPEKWGALSDEFAMCGKGKNQAPIDVTNAVVADISGLELDYRPSTLDVVNNGHTIKVNYAAGSSMTLDGRKFALKQFHFHAPSENHIGGKEYPFEAHFVHAADNGELAVLAVMFEEGRDNPVFSSFWKDLPQQADGRLADSKMTIDASKLLPSSMAYYRFNGSLTTPPCTEGVRWVVLKESVSLSGSQLAKFRKIMGHPNNRPIQASNARLIVTK